MKIAILAESFLPHMNGVTGSVLQAMKHLSTRGHELRVIAPDAGPIDRDLGGVQTELLRSLPFPSYPELRLAPASVSRITRSLKAFDPDVVHLASPFVLGWSGVRAADALRMPSVAVYQTDITAYAEKYGIPGVGPLAASHITRMHRKATLTLAPSSSARDFLAGLGIDRIRHWGRGVDADLFAPDRRDEGWRRRMGAGSNRVIVGYVGRLSPEKQVQDLAALHELPNVQLVIVGDGPSRAELERRLPRARFTGFLSGLDLARAVAGFDVFVHPGESDTFGQTIQEALASGVPVIATGVGGPVDLVQPSVNGWLYRPGDLGEMRDRVLDLTGDPAKRSAFSSAARHSVRGRTWAALCDQLLEHYAEAIDLREVDDALLVRPRERPRSAPAAAPPVAAPAWRRYVSLGDSITEGLCDTSRMPRGEFRGWAERLAMLLAGCDEEDRGIAFANLAVRSRRVQHLAAQVDRALELRPDLVSILVGSNDLVLSRVDIAALADRLEAEVVRVRESGAEVLLCTPFLPRRRLARILANRFSAYNVEVRRIARTHGCRILDIDTVPEIGDLEMWAEDRVHLTPAGHRLLAYRAADVLGVPNAATLGGLEHALHDGADGAEDRQELSWLRAHALPWVWRRVRGRTAGDGLSAKHSAYVELHASDAFASDEG